MRFFILAGALLATSTFANEPLDCSEPMTQHEINMCAAQFASLADEDLNLAYRLAIAQARSMDDYLEEGQTPAEEMLRAAQRAWITYRDLACEAESNLARGGSLQPTLFFSCLERETEFRTESLRYFGEVN